MKKTMMKAGYQLLPILSILLVLIGWLVLASSNDIIPGPLEAYERFVLMLEKPIKNTSILGHIWASLLRVLKGLGVSILFGIPFGLMIGWSFTFNGLFKPLFEIFRPIPAIAWIPLISIWFGVGEMSKVAIIILGAFMPIVVNTYTGVSLVPQLYIDAAKSFGASKRQMLLDVVFPASLQAIFAGIKTALSVGWMVVLASEMISAEQGLGFLIIRGSNSNDIALTMIGMVFVGIIGALISVTFNYFERRVLPWAKV